MSALHKYIDKDVSGEYPADIDLLVQAILTRSVNRAGVVGIVLYGSGLWQDGVAAADDKVWDLHVLVDDYKDFDASVFLAIAGSLLPHNVYFLQKYIEESDQTLNTKYNVMQLDQFQAHSNGQCVTPQIWARFCQPCCVVYARDENAKQMIVSSLTDCVRSFLSKSLPLIEGGKCHWQDVWIEGFAQTYKDEWRSEKKQRSNQIVGASEDRFKQRLAFALQEDQFPAYFIDDDSVRLNYSESDVTVQLLLRKVLRPFKKTVALCRLIKAAFTFENAAEYAVWKVERHSGHKVHLTEFQKKHPVIGGWSVMWKLWRQGVLK